MRTPLLLPGEMARSHRRVPLLTGLTLMLAVSLGLWRIWPIISAAIRPSVPNFEQSVIAEDMQVRLENIRSHLAKALEDSRKSQEQVRRVAPIIRGKGYPLQSRWLEASDAYDDATQQSIEQAFRETELALRIIKHERR